MLGGIVRRLAALVLLPALVSAACTSAPDSSDATGAGPEMGVTVGDTAPAFTFPTADGGEASLSDYRGRSVLLYFSMGPG
jgi:cytochrome oxidase Cu insertion factor (SCO1/SenC/PrrC family)